MTPPLTWLQVLAGLLRRRKWVSLPLGYGHRPVSAMLREVEGKTCSACAEYDQWSQAGRRTWLSVLHDGPCRGEGRRTTWEPAPQHRVYADRLQALQLRRCSGMSGRR